MKIRLELTKNEVRQLERLLMFTHRYHPFKACQRQANKFLDRLQPKLLEEK